MVNPHRVFVERFSWLGAVLVSTVGFAVLLGWVFDVAVLTSIVPGFATMKANTALAFLMAGVAALCHRQQTPGWRTIGRCLSLAVTTIGAATLAQYLFGVDLRIDELLIRDNGGQEYSGRPSPVTAASFLLSGVALVDMNWRPPGGRLARWSSLAVLALGSLALTGYVYDVDALYRVAPYTSMAVHTAATFVILSLSVVASQPTAGLVSIAISDTAGGTLARHLIPLLPVCFLLLGWVWLAGERAGLYGGSFGMAVMALSSTVVGAVVLTRYASLLHNAEVSRRQAEADARQLSAALADRKFEALIESAPDGMVIVNESGTIVLVNARTEELFGYDRQELLGQPVDLLLTDSFRAGHATHRAAFVRDPQSRPMSAKSDLRARRKDGTEFPVEVSLGPLRTEGGLLVSSAIRDVTARRRAEDALRESNERFSFASHAAEVGYWDSDITTNRVVWSDTCRALYGLPPETPASYEAWIETVHAEDRERAAGALRTAIESRQPFNVEYRIQHPHRGTRWLTGRGEVAYDSSGNPVRVAGVNIDVTERKQAEQAIRASLEEKETLLREIHHRVKNNLAVISSLLYLESTQAKESETVRLLQVARDRVLSMAMIHETLYNSTEFARLKVGAYLDKLLAHLLRSHATVMAKVTTRTQVDAVTMNLDTAVPLALVVNELVTNSLKHAFPDTRTGEICVALRLVNGCFVLRVTDTGVGVPPDLDAATTRTLGLRLVRSLSGQLGGEFRIQRANPGSEAILSFPAESETPHS